MRRLVRMHRPIGATLALIVYLAVGAAVVACDRGPPTIGDASTTSAAMPRGEQPLEPARGDAGTLAERGDASVSTGATAPGRPAWVPKDPSFTLVPVKDRDRNLGIVSPASTSIGIDAGGVQIDIEVRPR